jgi:ADP-ribose pyrophosphatase
VKWCASGQVTDAKTLTGMLWLANMLSGAWTLNGSQLAGLAILRP